MFSRRARLFCLIMIMLALGSSPWATAAEQDKTPPAQPSAAASAQAKELVHLVGMDQVMKRLSAEAVLPLVRQVMAADASFTPKDLDDMSRAWRETVWHDLQTELINAAAGIYAKRLSAQELYQAVAFFKSPAGRKLVTSQPQVTQQSGQAAQDVIKNWLARINADPKLRKEFFDSVAQKLPPDLRKKTRKP